jgi:hypothetical protein
LKNNEQKLKNGLQEKIRQLDSDYIKKQYHEEILEEKRKNLEKFI